MKIVVVTGAAGLVGSESVRYYAEQGYHVVGIDNNMRERFFGKDASTLWQKETLLSSYEEYEHFDVDIRDKAGIGNVFGKFNSDICMVIHTAAQPSHDWAASDPEMDFTVNANGTLVMLEAVREHCPEAVFIYTSTNKVYGDTPNRLPLLEQDTRWELDPSHEYAKDGIDESMSIDQTKHSLFGASKVAADVLTQEYGRYFGLKTGVFRGGCLTGPAHSGTKLHGFLSYLMKCAVTGTEYTVFGYGGKQVRDNIHSRDLVKAFDAFGGSARAGEVYNMGGSRHSNCSVNEAVAMCESICGRKMNIAYSAENRIGDHIWWVSSVEKFKNHYPDWRLTYTVEDILVEIHDAMVGRMDAGL